MKRAREECGFVDHGVIAFIDMLALTLVGILFTWSPQRTEAVSINLPEVTGKTAPVAAPPPLAVALDAEGRMHVDGRVVDIDGVLALVTAQARPVRIDADKKIAWGTVAAAVDQLRTKWQWVQVGVDRRKNPGDTR